MRLPTSFQVQMGSEAKADVDVLAGPPPVNATGGMKRGQKAALEQSTIDGHIASKAKHHALGCPPQKKASGGVTHCRGYLCEPCSAGLKKRECPFCGHEPILPLEKRPIFFPCAN